MAVLLLITRHSTVEPSTARLTASETKSTVSWSRASWSTNNYFCRTDVDCQTSTMCCLTKTVNRLPCTV